MSRSQKVIFFSLWIGTICAPAARVFGQPPLPLPAPVGTPEIKIDVPRKVGQGSVIFNGELQIAIVTASMSFASDTIPVILHITDPAGNLPTDVHGVTGNVTLTPGMPADTSCASGVLVCLRFPTPAGLCATNCFDTLNIRSATPTEPGSIRYVLEFNLFSNYNLSNSCTSTQGSDPDSFTITVVSGVSTNIVGVCLESFNIISQASCLQVNNRGLMAPGDGASVRGNPKPTFGCYKERPPVDVMLVLDTSGSMNTQTKFLSVMQARIDALRAAVFAFAKVWADLRSTEGSSPPPDKVGLITFNTTVKQQKKLEILSTFSFPVIEPPGGSTSIGDGLIKAGNEIVNAADGNRKVILLMSDGLQNTNPFVFTQNSVGFYCIPFAGPCGIPGVCISPVDSPQCALLPTPLPQIYTVTLGPMIDAAINAQMAAATQGFYLNTEENSSLLQPFFLELLQNFLRFNSYETVRMISETTPYSASIPLSTTSRDVEFSLMWPKNLGVLRLTITPPGGSEQIVQENESGFISIVQTLPLSPPFNPMGEWKVLVEAPRTIVDVNMPLASATDGTTVSANTGGIPFDLHVMTDDGGVKSDLSVVPGDYKPGDNIRLRAKLTQFGRPILGVGSHPGDRIEAELVRPGTSIGDLLSDSTASANSPPCPTPATCDKQSAAEAKLANMLQNNPSVLDRQKAPNIPLFDDGKPEHGDDVAGDGIYSALYTADLPGHYNFLFAVESVDPSTVRFSRQQLRTAYVRPFPDASKTEFQTNILSRGTLQIIMTPRCKAGDHMGPGRANYFWFTAAGVTPFKANDNLDGTYTATLNFSGTKPPKVSVHFENVIAIIGDSVTPDHLPQPLDSNNVLVDNIPMTGNWAVFLDLGAGFPNGTFGNAFNTGFSFNGGLEYMINSHFSAEGIFGYHHFPAKIGSSLNIYQFSGNAKVYLTPPQKFRPFVNGGIGGYHFSLGSTTDFGGNFGGGVLVELTQRFGLQGSYNFHVVNTPGGATKFSTLQGGIRWVF